MVWTNAPLKAYHGTTHASALSISTSSVNPVLCRAIADFGQGFYLTTHLHQAQQWANQKVRSLPHGSHVSAVLTFNIDRDLLGGHGDHLTFVLPDTDFHEFVLFNRFGSSNHGRFGKIPHDVIYGPVAAYPQTLTYANCDQICFSSGGKAIGSLPTPNPSILIGNPYFP